MSSPFAIVKESLEQNMPEARRNRSWRDALRAQVGQHGEKLNEILFELAQGNAWTAHLPDGRISAPVLPSSDVRLRAAIYLHEALNGKSVAQTEIQKAEQEAKELEAVHALNDDELEAEAFRIIEARKVRQLTPGRLTVEAEFTQMPKPSTVDVHAEDLAAMIFAAPYTPEDQE